MAEMTSLQQANAIAERVEMVMKLYVLPQLQAKVYDSVRTLLPEAIKTIVDEEVRQWVGDMVRDIINSRLHITVTVDDV